MESGGTGERNIGGKGQFFTVINKKIQGPVSERLAGYILGY